MRPRSPSRVASSRPRYGSVTSPTTGWMRSPAPSRPPSSASRSAEDGRTSAWTSPSRARRRSSRCRPMKPVAPVTNQVGTGLPAAAHVGPRGPGLGCALARVLALVEAPLEHAHHEDEEGEERDQDEPGGRDHLVVRLPPPALAPVVSQRGRSREGQDGDRQQRGAEGGSAHRSAAYRGVRAAVPWTSWPSSSPPISPRTWPVSPCCAASPSSWSGATG